MSMTVHETGGILSSDLSLSLEPQSFTLKPQTVQQSTSSSASDWANTIALGLQSLGQVMPGITGQSQAQARTARDLRAAEEAKLGQMVVSSSYHPGGPGYQQQAGQDSGWGLSTWLLVGGAALGGVLLISSLMNRRGRED